MNFRRGTEATDETHSEVTLPMVGGSEGRPESWGKTCKIKGNANNDAPPVLNTRRVWVSALVLMRDTGGQYVKNVTCEGHHKINTS